MKKFIALVLALAMVFSFAACAKKDDKKDDKDKTTTAQGAKDTDAPAPVPPVDDTKENETGDVEKKLTPVEDCDVAAIVSAAYVKFAMADSAELNTVDGMILAGDTMSLESIAETNVKISGINSDDTVIREIAKISMLGMNLETDSFIKDGYRYVTSEDANYKEALEEKIGISYYINVDMQSIEAVLANAEAYVDEEGNYTFKSELTPDQIIALNAGDISELEGMGPNSIKDANAEIYVDKDGNFGGYAISFKCAYSDESMGNGECQMSMAVEIVKIGDVVVEAPEGYEDYEEFSFDFDDEDIVE